MEELLLCDIDAKKGRVVNVQRNSHEECEDDDSN